MFRLVRLEPVAFLCRPFDARHLPVLQSCVGVIWLMLTSGSTLSLFRPLPVDDMVTVL